MYLIKERYLQRRKNAMNKILRDKKKSIYQYQQK